MEQILNLVVWDGQTLGDLLSAEFVLGVFGKVVAAMAILVAGFTVSGWVRRRIFSLSQKHEELDKTLFNFIGNISRYAILAFTILFILNTFGVQTTSLVAVFGAAGLAIGLALQGTLSNVAAGVMIILFRPFKLDDFVEVNGQMGTVKDISLNYTELATLANAMLYQAARSLLFKLDPETAHDLSLTSLSLMSSVGLNNLLRVKTLSQPVEVMGIQFPNPVGLAAGLDKNGIAVDGMAALGFGFIEVGTVTPRPQPGNPQPRLFRIPEHGR